MLILTRVKLEQQRFVLPSEQNISKKDIKFDENFTTVSPRSYIWAAKYAAKIFIVL